MLVKGQNLNILKSVTPILSITSPFASRAWINEMIAKVTAPDLAQDVPGAEALKSRHMELRAEMDTRSDAFDRFYATGESLIKRGHFMANDVGDKIATLKQRNQQLFDLWDSRRYIYEQNLDTQVRTWWRACYKIICFTFYLPNLIKSSTSTQS